MPRLKRAPRAPSADIIADPQKRQQLGAALRDRRLKMGIGQRVVAEAYTREYKILFRLANIGTIERGELKKRDAYNRLDRVLSLLEADQRSIAS